MGESKRKRVFFERVNEMSGVLSSSVGAVLEQLRYPIDVEIEGGRSVRYQSGLVLIERDNALRGVVGNTGLDGSTRLFLPAGRIQSIACQQEPQELGSEA